MNSTPKNLLAYTRNLDGFEQIQGLIREARADAIEAGARLRFLEEAGEDRAQKGPEWVANSLAILTGTLPLPENITADQKTIARGIAASVVARAVAPHFMAYMQNLSGTDLLTAYRTRPGHSPVRLAVVDEVERRFTLANGDQALEDLDDALTDGKISTRAYAQALTEPLTH